MITHKKILLAGICLGTMVLPNANLEASKKKKDTLMTNKDAIDAMKAANVKKGNLATKMTSVIEKLGIVGVKKDPEAAKKIMLGSHHAKGKAKSTASKKDAAAAEPVELSEGEEDTKIAWEQAIEIYGKNPKVKATIFGKMGSEKVEYIQFLQSKTAKGLPEKVSAVYKKLGQEVPMPAGAAVSLAVPKKPAADPKKIKKAPEPKSPAKNIPAPKEQDEYEYEYDDSASAPKKTVQDKPATIQKASKETRTDIADAWKAIASLEQTLKKRNPEDVFKKIESGSGSYEEESASEVLIEDGNDAVDQEDQILKNLGAQVFRLAQEKMESMQEVVLSEQKRKEAFNSVLPFFEKGLLGLLSKDIEEAPLEQKVQWANGIYSYMLSMLAAKTDLEVPTQLSQYASNQENYLNFCRTCFLLVHDAREVVVQIVKNSAQNFSEKTKEDLFLSGYFLESGYHFLARMVLDAEFENMKNVSTSNDEDTSLVRKRRK